MSMFEQMLDKHTLPTSEDLDMTFPVRREPKKDVAAPTDALELGQHGGGGEGTPADAEGVVDVAGGDSGPVPQRDEPDDGEHTDSTEAQVLARATAAAPEEAEEVDAAGVTAEEAPEEAAADPEPAEVEDEAPTSPQDPAADLLAIEGTDPKAFKRGVGFSYDKGVKDTTVTRFPQPIIDKLRLQLAASTSGAFAEAISAPALITAFLVANLGIEFNVDENTAAAIDGFRTTDPRLLGIEEKLELALASIDRVAATSRVAVARATTAANAAETVEYATAYLVADRVAGLSTSDVNETNVDVTQPKALTVRDAIRSRSKAQRTIEKNREERSTA